MTKSEQLLKEIDGLTKAAGLVHEAKQECAALKDLTGREAFYDHAILSLGQKFIDFNNLISVLTTEYKEERRKEGFA